MRLTAGLLFFLLWIQGEKGHASSDVSLGADIQYQENYFPQSYGEDTNRSLAKFEIDPILSWKKGEHWRLYARPTAIINPDNRSNSEKFFFDPTEAYVKFQKDVLRIQIGFNQVTWGVTDGYNPLDVVNTKQYFDPLKAKKMGSLSLFISESLAWFDYDFLYIPKARASLLPGDQSRWLPQEIFIPQTSDNNLILLLPQDVRYSYGDHGTLNKALDNNIALRLQKNFSVLDVSISGYEGVASFPLIQPQVTGTITQVSPKTVIQVSPDVVLNTKDYRIRQTGFSLIAHPGDSLVKYESSYTQSIGDDSNLPGWTHENIVAFEHTFNTANASLIGILQYSFLNTEKKNDSNLSVTEIFRNTWMLGGRLAWKEVWNASLLALYNQSNSSHLEEISLGRRFFDAWTVSLTADFISGSRETPLGVYSKNNSYTLAISRSF